MEKKFRKGDKVRYIGDGEFEEFLFSCKKGDEFIVDEADEDSVTVYLSNWQVFYNEDLELVSPPNDDRKTAFLQELKALLEKYDARFGDYEGYSVYFQIGDDSVSWGTPDYGVGAEDVFDYDKD